MHHVTGLILSFLPPVFRPGSSRRSTPPANLPLRAASAACLAAAFCLAAAGPGMAGRAAHAQTAPALERNLPLELPGDGSIELDEAVPAQVSDTPIGVDLAGVRLEGLAGGGTPAGAGPAAALVPGITVVDVDGVA